ncbi:MAG: restriction endonuclease subunit S [Polaromonas sp.]
MSLPRYPEYKDSGVDWLGDMPGHWHCTKIKYTTYVKGRVGWHGLNSDEFEEEGVHLVTGTDFDNGFVAWDRCYRISETRYLEDPYIQLKENDLLITKDGTIGKLARVKNLPERASLNSGIFLVRAINKAYLEDFLYWILQSSLFSHFMDLHKVGSTIQHLYQEVFNKFAFPIPSQSEQQIICAFLDRETGKIDALIAEQRRLVELLAEKRQAVISHAVTKGLNPNAPMKDSGIEWLGEVPAHWEIGPLRRYWSVTDCKHVTAEFVEDGIPLASIREVQRRWVTLEEAKCTTEHFYELLIEGGRRPLPGDLIFSRNATVGEVAQVSVNHPRFAMGQDVVLLRKLSPEYSSDFLQHVIRSPIIILQLANMMIGSTFKRINVEEIRSFIVPSPPNTEQAEIAAFLESEVERFDTLTAEANRASALLQERRSALISAAVTGKIDVRQAA